MSTDIISHPWRVFPRAGWSALFITRTRALLFLPGERLAAYRHVHMAGMGVGAHHPRVEDGLRLAGLL